VERTQLVHSLGTTLALFEEVDETAFDEALVFEHLGLPVRRLGREHPGPCSAASGSLQAPNSSRRYASKSSKKRRSFSVKERLPASLPPYLRGLYRTLGKEGPGLRKTTACGTSPAGSWRSSDPSAKALGTALARLFAELERGAEHKTAVGSRLV
jgi:hypothetical protein